MRDGGDVTAGLFLVVRQPGPEVARVPGANRRSGGVGHHLTGALGAVTEDHVAVQVVAGDQRGPLEGDEGGEGAGIVELLRGADDVVPDALVGGVAGLVVELGGDLALGELIDQPEHGLGGGLPAGVEVLVELASLRVRQDVRRAVDDVGDGPHGVGVVGDHEKVVGAGELHRLAGVGDHLLAAGEAVGVARHQAGTGAARVGRQTGMHVGVAEIDIGREGPVRIGRVGSSLQDPLSHPGIVRVLGGGGG